MKEYAYVTIQGEMFFGTEIRAHREIIDKYAADGYKYVGYIPVIMRGGNIEEMDLIFEKEII